MPTDNRARDVIARVLFEQANEVPPGHDASAIMAQWREQGGLTASFVREFERRADAIITALRADPDAMAGLAGLAGEAFALVPKEPTELMETLGMGALRQSGLPGAINFHALACYRAMISPLPTPPTETSDV